MAVVFFNIELTEKQGSSLSSKAKEWINAIHNAFPTRELSSEELELVERYKKPTTIKGFEE
ncbi:MAG: hypothetical protein HQL32_13995 [Planctomycetes bacterium]|nr:hypothetical protein [Planctomycetota bacterium]